MVRTDIIRGKMAEKGISQLTLASALKESPKTFREHMQRGVFNSDEIYSMCQILSIENVKDVFFADIVS